MAIAGHLPDGKKGFRRELSAHFKLFLRISFAGNSAYLASDGEV